MPAVFDYLEEGHGQLPGTEHTLRKYIRHLIDINQLKFKAKLRIYHLGSNCKSILANIKLRTG
ncbi:hypothetical protein ES703_116991 [subsurface metagenome]